MTHPRNPLAGLPAPASLLIDVDALIAAYHDERPDPAVPDQRVLFGTSGHRGTSLARTFNEDHVLAIAQAICEYRAHQGTRGPLFLGIDTHALSKPAAESALAVLAANGVDVMLATNDDFTPTPAVSHAILVYNRDASRGTDAARADGIIVSPSHNPPGDGGIKYNPPHGGPAGQDETRWIEDRANALLVAGLDGVRRIPLASALKASTTHRHDFLHRYVEDLEHVVDLDIVRASGLRMGVDPLGGAGIHYWPAIAERYRLDLTVVNPVVDPQFGFMTVDSDGKIRMDPSSPDAMERLTQLKDRFDIAFACDPDHDRHGIVTPTVGLIPPNHYLAVAIDYLFRHRPDWKAGAGVGKTVVSTRVIDAVAARLGRPLVEVPVGFKWFVDGLHDGTLGFGGEESAGAAFLRRDGTVWTTDKDGLIAGLLSAEMTARTGRDPGRLYADLAAVVGDPVADRVEAPAGRLEKQRLSKLSPDRFPATTLAGEAIERVASHAPGNGAAIGGIKVETANGWFAARPSGTEAIYKIYAESFLGDAHLQAIFREAQAVVDQAIAADD